MTTLPNISSPASQPPKAMHATFSSCTSRKEPPAIHPRRASVDSLVRAPLRQPAVPTSHSALSLLLFHVSARKARIHLTSSSRETASYLSARQNTAADINTGLSFLQAFRQLCSVAPRPRSRRNASRLREESQASLAARVEDLKTPELLGQQMRGIVTAAVRPGCATLSGKRASTSLGVGGAWC